MHSTKHITKVISKLLFWSPICSSSIKTEACSRSKRFITTNTHTHTPSEHFETKPTTNQTTQQNKWEPNKEYQGDWTYPTNNRNQWSRRLGDQFYQKNYTQNDAKTRWSRTKKAPAVVSLANNEWSLPPKLVKLTEVTQQIQQSRELTGNITEVTTEQEAQEIITRHTSFECPHSLTLLFTGSTQKKLRTLMTAAKVTRLHQQQKVEHIGLSYLGDENKIPWRRPATSFQKKTIPTAARTTIRVAAPEIFRTLFHPKDSVQRILCDLANWTTDIATSSLTGANWQHQEFDKQNLIVGWLHLTTKEAQLLLEHLGKMVFSATSSKAVFPPNLFCGLIRSKEKPMTIISDEQKQLPLTKSSL